MKKRMAAFLLTAVMTVALTAGCGSSSGSAAPEKTGTEEAGAVTEEAGEENRTEAAGEEAGEENGTEAVGKEAVAEAGTEAAGKEAGAEGTAGEVRETTSAAAQDRTAGLHRGLPQHFHAGSCCEIQ